MVLKKFLVTILALIYLATTTGATLHMHYCMGKIFSVDMVKKDGCSKCGMKTNGGCCKDEFKVIKVNDNHQLATNQINFAPVFAALNNNYNITEPVSFDTDASLTTHNNSPPNSSGTSLCILNCVFRI